MCLDPLALFILLSKSFVLHPHRPYPPMCLALTKDFWGGGREGLMTAIVATKKDSFKRQWFSGKIQHSHCWAPSLILGSRTQSGAFVTVLVTVHVSLWQQGLPLTLTQLSHTV